MKTQFSVMPGSLVRCREREAVVLDFVDLTTVLVDFADDESVSAVHLSELSPWVVNEASGEAKRMQRLAEEALPLISDKRWRAARTRLNVLRDILGTPKHFRRQATIAAAAAELGKSVPTIYRWLERYETTRSIKALMRVERADKGKVRVAETVERIVDETIRKEYLEGKNSPATVAELVRKVCFTRGVTPPHDSTVFRRIHRLDPHESTKAREGRKAAKEKYDLRIGAYPKVDYPLAHTQIDHTPADYCLVDEVHRKPINGSPTFTLCIDVNTRCILGFTLAIEAPSIRLAGECVIHSILRKERFLSDLEVNADWPCFGVPSLIMTDNASEFEASDFVKACNAWGIEMRKRPKGAPNYAGLIESTFRTYLTKIHEVDGGRQPGKGQRSMAYDIKGRPVMTLREFRRWMTIFITKYYHQKPHSGLNGLPPIEAWRRGILGWGDQKGIGLPDQVTDEFKLRVDFLRTELRTVQDYGIRFAHHAYSGDILRQWVGSRDPDNAKLARKFVVKYDPWDITEIYFLDPLVGRYFPLNSTSPLEHLTLWECELIGRSKRKENYGVVNDTLIYEGLDEMREQVESSAKSTRTARRHQQRVIESQRTSVKARRKIIESAAEEVAVVAPVDDDDGPLRPLSGAIEAQIPVKEQPL